MAVPALPADVNSGDTWTAALVNAIYDHLQWWRDTRPLFSGIGETVTLTTATLDEAGHGTVSATFGTTPAINVGSWAVSSDSNPDGIYNVEVPEAGIFAGFWQCTFAANSTGRRQIVPRLNSVNIAGTSIQLPTTAAGVCNIVAAFQVDCASGDELSVDMFQNSGGNLDATPYLHARWVQST